MEWLMDPTAWVGLLTLVVLEIVLGIDNLVFIAILVDKLPPAQRDRARTRVRWGIRSALCQVICAQAAQPRHRCEDLTHGFFTRAFGLHSDCRPNAAARSLLLLCVWSALLRLVLTLTTELRDIFRV